MRLYLSSFRLGNRPEVFVDLLRGEKRVAVICNAGDHRDALGRADAVQQEMEAMQSLGLEPEEIDLRKYFGNPDALRKALTPYAGVWVRGGISFNLRRAFRYSGADAIFTELLTQDKIVYAGYSAGPDMLTPHLHGTELVDDPNNIPAGYQAEIIWEGLNLVPYAFAPHYKSDHPESEAISRLVEHFIDHHIPFIALRDGEAIVRDGGREEVVG